jgi:hypothetical protein
LWDYLEHLGARTFVREHHYVDRHYLDDFTSYYARSFRVPDHACRRLHYFDLTQRQLSALLDRAHLASAEERRKVEAKLSLAYLGFVVRRDLKRARLGRTVLRTYPLDGKRRYSAVRPYVVHLGALQLQVIGLAYQQQDGGAAVCASTALWSALQKVAHMAGHRTPTPSAITAASKSPYAASYGLDDSQMAHAIATLGYGADLIGAQGDPATFRALLAACLRSHLPVILAVEDLNGSHAITVTGYSEPDDVVDVPPYEGEETSLRMRAGAVRVIYAHDDNLGSHAHYELVDAPPQDLMESWVDQNRSPDGLWLLRGRSDKTQPAWWTESWMRVASAIVPKPSKVRMPVTDLLKLAWALRHTAAIIFDGLEIDYEVAFTTGVEYRRQMFEMRLEKARLRAFHESAVFPRHLAVMTVRCGENHLCDFLLDATAVDLGPDDESLIAIVAPGVPARSLAWKNVESVAEFTQIPIIGAPPAPPKRRRSS